MVMDKETICRPCEKYNSLLAEAQQTAGNGHYEGIVISNNILQLMYNERVESELQKAVLETGFCTGCSKLSIYDKGHIDDYLFLGKNMQEALCDRDERQATKILCAFGESMREAQGDELEAELICMERLKKENIDF